MTPTSIEEQTMAGTPDPDQLAELCRLGTATVHEAQGKTGAVDSEIKGVAPRLRLAGTACTVQARPGDNLAIHYAMTVARPGDVLVVDAGGYVEAGPWGDLLTTFAQQRGLSGLVIDGAVRDVEAIVESGFPVFSRGISIKGTEKNQPGRVGEPVVCGGVLVRPGDIVLGDRDGVVVVPAEDVASTLAAAVARERHEEELRTKLRAGESLADLLGLTERFHRLGYVA